MRPFPGIATGVDHGGSLDGWRKRIILRVCRDWCFRMHGVISTMINVETSKRCYSLSYNIYNEVLVVEYSSGLGSEASHSGAHDAGHTLKKV